MKNISGIPENKIKLPRNLYMQSIDCFNKYKITKVQNNPIYNP